VPRDIPYDASDIVARYSGEDITEVSTRSS
jgi:hypothetical protein